MQNKQISVIGISFCQLDKAFRVYYNISIKNFSNKGEKMNRKTKTLFVLLVAIITCVLFAVISSAASYKANYCSISGSQKASATTDENGKIVLRDTAVTTTDGKVFYGWFTEEGDFYAPGTEVTLTQDTKFREAYAYVVTDLAGLKNYLAQKNAGGLVRLDVDLDLTEGTGAPGWKDGGGNTVYLDLNGHSITTTGADSLFSSTRLGLNLLNSSSTEAKITANSLSADSAVFTTKKHGYGDGKNLAFSVGKNVYVETNSALFKVGNDYNDGSGGEGNECPYIRIWGRVVCETLVNVNTKKTHLADIRFYSSADVTFTGDTWWRNPTATYTAPVASLSIFDGAKITIVNSDTFDWSVNALAFEYHIEGGYFNVNPPAGMLGAGYEAVFNEQTRLYHVEFTACTIEGSNGVHTHTMQEAYEGKVATCTSAGVYVFRCACGDQYVADVEALGHSYTIVKIVTPATTTQSGTKEYTCETCKASTYTESYTLDASETEITLTVKTEDGTKQITVLLKDAYNITTSGNVVTFNGVASSIAYGEEAYTKTDIVKLTIPVGVTNVATGAFNGMSVLEEIVVGDGANVNFATKSFQNCSALKLLTASNCTVTFEATAVENCPNFATIDIKTANATFKKSAFSSNTSIKHLLMASGHTYSFGEDAFRYSGLEEVILPDNATVTVAKKSFAETITIKYIYVGANCIASKRLADESSLFGGNSNLHTAIFMDIEYIGRWVLSTKTPGQAYGPLCDLKVYMHSPTIGFSEKGAFNTRNGDYKVYLYIDTNSMGYTGNPFAGDDGKSTPNLIIYDGIPHAYTEGGSSATCTTAGAAAYSTDCPCGVIADATYTVTAYSGYTGDTTGGTISVGAVTEAL